MIPTIHHHRGFEISHNPRSRAVCPFHVYGLRRDCRTLADAHALIDAHLSAEPTPGPRIVAADTSPRLLLSAGQCRNRAEQARAQDRESGRFIR